MLRRILLSIRCWPRSLRRQPGAAHLSLGRRGETIAAHYLRRNGFRVLYRNFRAKRGGEIDLVCRDRREKTLVFVEVKTRTTDAFGPPHEGVTQTQRDRIIRGAKEWLRLLDDPRVPYRFDVVEVVMEPGPQVHLIRGAFQMPDDIYL
ncbi:MAG: YraN family protein [Verrucomicrobia bacterium]|nr:YraN family protein [Verrucomicrobiota bacterium]